MLIRLLCVHEMNKRVQNFAFKFQAVAEKTAKKMLGATLFCRTLYSHLNFISYKTPICFRLLQYQYHC